jgi:hypothetical protein
MIEFMRVIHMVRPKKNKAALIPVVQIAREKAGIVPNIPL